MSGAPLEGKWFQEAMNSAQLGLVRFAKAVPKTDTFFDFVFFGAAYLYYLGLCVYRFKKPSAEASYATILPPLFASFLSIVASIGYQGFHAVAQWVAHNKIATKQQTAMLVALAETCDRLTDNFLFLAFVTIIYQRRKDLVAELNLDKSNKLLKKIRPRVWNFFIIALGVTVSLSQFLCRLRVSQADQPMDASHCVRSETSGRYSFYLFLFGVTVATLQLYGTLKSIAGSKYGQWDRHGLPTLLIFIPFGIWLRLYLGASIGVQDTPTSPWDPTPGMGTLLVRTLVHWFAIGALLHKRSIRVPSTPTEVSVLEDTEAQRFALPSGDNGQAAATVESPLPQISEKGELPPADSAPAVTPTNKPAEQPLLVLLEDDPVPEYEERVEGPPHLIVFDSDDED